MNKRHQQRTLFDKNHKQQSNDTHASEHRPETEPVDHESTVTSQVIDDQDAGDIRGKSVWVIDAHSLIYQLFHAMPEMSGPKGESVGAVYGFLRDMLSIIQNHRPDFLLCAFDMPGKTFRHELYEPYKETRDKMPDDLQTQIPLIRRMLQAMSIPALGVESYEADDIMATVVERTTHAGAQCVVVTADKDCRQLINDSTRLFNVRKQSHYDAENLMADWGITPEQVVDFQALVGDSSDNVPGVALFGPKLTTQLIEKYGTLENILDHAEEVSGKKRKQNLIEGREIALLSRKLVELDRNVPVEIDWASARVGKVDRHELHVLCDEWGFRSVQQKIDALVSPEGDIIESPGQQNGSEQVNSTASSHPVGNLFDKSEPPPKSQIDATYHLIDTQQKFDDFLEQLRAQPCFSVDLETTSINPRAAEPVGYSFCWNDTEAWYVPVRGPKDDAVLDPQLVLESLRPILEDPQIKKIGQNLKYDMVVLRGQGALLRGLEFDTMVAAYLLDAGRRNHNLDDLALHYLGHTTIKYSDLCGKGKSQKRIDEVPTRAVADYAGEDALIPVLLRPILETRLQASGLDRLWHELEKPLIDVLVEMEFNGVRIDCERLARMSVEHAEQLVRLEAEIHKIAGHEFNINSPKQLQVVLFDELGLPVIKKTQTGASTDVEVLQELADKHVLPAKIMEYRQIAKLKSTYIDALPEMICEKTDRVHTSFNQVVTATGRLSSSDPNLQNIPIRTEEGRAIRSAFIPGEPDWLLMAADYSQIELRVLAHYSGDENLCRSFENDEDIHARVAGEVFDVPLEEVTSEQRRKAKAVNFGVVYGQSAFGLAKQLKIDKSEAARFIDAYFARYPGITRFLERVLADCRRDEFVSTILGRRREVVGIRSPGSRGQQSTLAERTAINTVIQGSAADLIKLAMIRVLDQLKQSELNARLLIQIHDELVFEVAKDDADALETLVREAMEGAYALAVPLKVDINRGNNWGEAK